MSVSNTTKRVKDIRRNTRRKFSSEEKIRIVLDGSRGESSIAELCRQEGINSNLYYRWYQAYERDGPDGLQNHSRASRKHWNRIPDSVRELVVDVALDQPELTPRELAWHLADTHEYFISESSVYRILKAHDLVTSPQFVVMSAADAFQNPTRYVHELWQTDFTYFRVVGWGWYFLSTILDDYSRYIISWRLTYTILPPPSRVECS